MTDAVETTETISTDEATIDAPEALDVESLKAEIDKWKSLSRKNETNAKANLAAAKELEALKQSQLTETERLVAQTKAETAEAIRREFAGKLVESELKAALNGRSVDATALLGFDKNSFITAEGEVDSDAITAFVEAHSKTVDVPAPNLGQGVRGENPSKAQIRSRDELANMSPADILAARKDGRLDFLLGKN